MRQMFHRARRASSVVSPEGYRNSFNECNLKQPGTAVRNFLPDSLVSFRKASRGRSQAVRKKRRGHAEPEFVGRKGASTEPLNRFISRIYVNENKHDTTFYLHSTLSP